MLTLMQLQYAIEVERHRHFGKAARACHVTQPTLSQQLQKLEDEIGLILFDRAKKPILPTPEGLDFLAQAKTVLREHEKLVQVSRRSREGAISGDFRLAVIPTVSSHLLPLILMPFSKAHPKVRLLIEEMKTETILRELAGDHLDGAILATPIEGADFKINPLYYEPFYAYFSAKHELLRRSQIAREDLNLSEMWLLQDGHCFRDQVLSFCKFSGDKAQIQPNVRFQSGSLDTLLKMVQTQQGYTLIPAMMALALRRDERAAHVRPFHNPVPTREISLVYRRDHWKLEIIRAIEETVGKCLPAGIQQKVDKGFRVLDVC